MRIRSPYNLKKIGTGMNANAMNPNKLFPQPRPRASNMDKPARGSTAPKTERRTVLAAIAEAAWIVKASTR